MIKKGWIAFLSCFLAIIVHAQYVPDYLGDGYTHRTFEMPDDYSGKVVCTLVKKEPDTTLHKAILYIHGYNDYFFQKQLGDSAKAHGYNFYALDLRKYGRSIRVNQDTFFCKSLTEYYADIDTALYTIRKDGYQPEQTVLIAHSTGGLISPLYLQNKGHKLPVQALVLNSPFLDMNMNWFLKDIGVPVIAWLGKYYPHWQVQGRSLSMYSESLLKKYHGEWEYKTDWKLTYGHPIEAGWLRAIHEGHLKIHKGLNLQCPILVMSSNRSIHPTDQWDSTYLQADIVLNVEDIQKYGGSLGPHVTRCRIQNGIHDLILSQKPVRDQVYATIFNWLDQLP